jgi:hypothetical protein
VVEEGLVLHGAFGVYYWSWILHGTITGVHSHKRPIRRLVLDTAADVQCEPGVTGT